MRIIEPLVVFTQTTIEAVGHLILGGTCAVMPAQLREGSWYEADENTIVGALIPSADGSYSYTLWLRTDIGDYIRLRSSGGYAALRDALLDMEHYALPAQIVLPHK